MVVLARADHASEAKYLLVALRLNDVSLPMTKQTARGSPESFVDSMSVSEFQSKLTSKAKRMAEGADEACRKAFSSCDDVLAMAERGA